MLKEFRYPILFIAKFLLLYLVMNLSYGFYLENHGKEADPFTYQASLQTSILLSMMGEPTEINPSGTDPKVYLNKEGKAVLSVYEGCNGINVMIIFVAFVLSFSPPRWKMLWFVPLGILFIHLINLGRIALLYFVTENMPHYLYFAHKYLFTAIIYVGVFLLWYLWVTKINAEQLETSP